MQAQNGQLHNDRALRHDTINLATYTRPHLQEWTGLGRTGSEGWGGGRNIIWGHGQIPWDVRAHWSNEAVFILFLRYGFLGHCAAACFLDRDFMDEHLIFTLCSGLYTPAGGNSPV